MPVPHGAGRTERAGSRPDPSVDQTSGLAGPWGRRLGHQQKTPPRQKGKVVYFTPHVTAVLPLGISKHFRNASQ